MQRTTTPARPDVGKETWHALAVFILIVLLPALATGSQERPVHQVPRALTAIVIDGLLDDAAWATALSMPLILEVYPGKNLPASVATDCFIAYDREYFYVGFRARDNQPETIRAHYTGRDRIEGDDRIGITIDTFNDGRRGYSFWCNPLGVQQDDFRDDYGIGTDKSWDAIWHSAGRLTAEGFDIEIAIPFDQIRFQEVQGPQTWGFTAIRVMPRSISYEFATQELDFYVREYFVQFSKIRGFEDVRTGAHMQLMPTYTAVTTDERADFPFGAMQPGTLRGEGGLSGRWSPTSGITLSGALNPDFSHVEADVAQLDVNISSVLYYPEKRPFFMESASTFTTPFEAVYTRMLADPSWGVKLTGRDSDNSYGLFGIGDEQTTLIVPGSQYSRLVTLDRSSTTTIGRFQHELGGLNALGALVTDRRGEGYRNSVFGLDGVWYPSDSDSVTYQILQSSSRYDADVAAELGSADTSLDGHAARVLYVHNTRELDWYFYYDDIGDGFRADTGYINRIGYRQIQTGAGYVFWMDRDSPLINHNYWAAWHRTEERDGTLLHDGLTLWANVRGPLQSTAYLYLYDTRFRYGGREFDLRYSRFYLLARPYRGVVTVLDVNAGDSIDYTNAESGTHFHIAPYISVRLTRNVEITVQHDYERFNRDGGQLFEANLSQVRAVLHFDERSFLRLTAQYYDLERQSSLYRARVTPTSRSLLLQMLYSYVINPQTVLFVGYSDSAYGDGVTALTTHEQTVFVKIGYAFMW